MHSFLLFLSAHPSTYSKHVNNMFEKMMRDEIQGGVQVDLGSELDTERIGHCRSWFIEALPDKPPIIRPGLRLSGWTLERARSKNSAFQAITGRGLGEFKVMLAPCC